MSINGYIKARRAIVIIVDEHVLVGAKLAAEMEQYKKDLAEGSMGFMDSCSMVMAREMEPIMACEEEYDPRYHNWKDFIQNPARPGRQIKKQKPPKQSFKAQMRSVNRNR